MEKTQIANLSKKDWSEELLALISIITLSMSLGMAFTAKRFKPFYFINYFVMLNLMFSSVVIYLRQHYVINRLGTKPASATQYIDMAHEDEINKFQMESLEKGDRKSSETVFIEENSAGE
jgi:hypothetical protein